MRTPWCVFICLLSRRQYRRLPPLPAPLRGEPRTLRLLLIVNRTSATRTLYSKTFYAHPAFIGHDGF